MANRSYNAIIEHISLTQNKTGKDKKGESSMQHAKKKKKQIEN